MFNEQVIKKLQDENVLRKNINNLKNYVLLIDEDITARLDFRICIWKNGMITIQNDIWSINAELIGKKLSGRGSRNYRTEILEGIKQFKDKHKEILSLIESL